LTASPLPYLVARTSSGCSSWNRLQSKQQQQRRKGRSRASDGGSSEALVATLYGVSDQPWRVRQWQGGVVCMQQVEVMRVQYAACQLGLTSLVCTAAACSAVACAATACSHLSLGSPRVTK
jgi:hypothetical protein